MPPRRQFHSSARRSRKDDEEDDDDNPWGDLDKAFENLQDKSLYKQVYLNHPTQSSTPPAAAPKAKDPIAEMEEAIFAQAGAAAVKGVSKPKRNMTMAPLSGVKFSDLPPTASYDGMAIGNVGGDGPGAGAKWSEYMQGSTGEEGDDSPWSSLDAFVDNPDASAQFAVPLHLQDQQNVMQLSAQQYSPQHQYATHQPPHTPQQPHTAHEALAVNTALLQQQAQLHDPEEAMFTQAGAAAVANLFPNNEHSPSSSVVEDATQLSHVDPATGGASMVDVSSKRTTARSATAVGRVYLPSSAAALIRATESHTGVSGKGPVLHTAQLAGIMAAKRTAELIPLCHPLPLTHVDVRLNIVDPEENASEAGGEEGESWVQIECTARTAGQTGVEMEALTGCTMACLTVWDMAKAVAGKTMRMGDIMVFKKSGGKSGDWQRSH